MSLDDEVTEWCFKRGMIFVLLLLLAFECYWMAVVVFAPTMPLLLSAGFAHFADLLKYLVGWSTYAIVWENQLNQ